MSAGDVLVVREALDGLHEARARLDDLLMATSAPQGIELFASILSTVKRLLRELDLDERIRRQVQMLRTSRPRASRYGTAGPPGVRPPDSAEPDPDAETQVLPAARRSRRDKRRT